MKTQSYGGSGRRPVDPTRQQIRQRIREVDAIRSAETDKKEAAVTSRIVGLLQRTSGMSCPAIAAQLGDRVDAVRKTLRAMIELGTVDRVGGGGHIVYQLVAVDHDSIGLESAESILARFRAKQSRRRSVRAA